MKKVLAGIVSVIFVVLAISLTNCQYVRQGEKAFFYDVSSGKAVNAKDNPLLPMGFNSAWGWNQRSFSVLGTIMDYEFTGPGTGSSSFDETLGWNSSEGVVMSVEYKLYGRVSDPWEFFIHFGEPEHSYKITEHKDIRVYEALRQAGRELEKRLNEEAAEIDAETIRTQPEALKAKLLPHLRDYMKFFGFEITDLIFMKNFQYPDGNVITEARKKLTDLDSEIRGLSQQKENKQTQIKNDVEQAKIEKQKKIGEAQRQANASLAESSAMATALQQSIEQIGVAGTMRLRMAELYATLSKAGAVPTVVVTEESLFAAPFYPVVAGGLTNSVHKK